MRRVLLTWISMALPVVPAVALASALETHFRADKPPPVQLSPDGEFLAAIDTVPAFPHARNLLTLRLADGQAHAITGFADIDVQSFFWGSDKRIVFTTLRRDGAVADTPLHRTYSIQRDGKRGRVIATTTTAQRLTLLDRLAREPRRVLVTRAPSNPVQPEVFLLDLGRGSSRRILGNDLQATSWLSDRRGTVRAAIAADGDEHERLLYRAGVHEPWRRLTGFARGELALLGFHADNRRLIVASRFERERHALCVFDPDSAAISALLVADPLYDVWGPDNGVLMQSASGHLVAYRYLADEPTTVYFDARWSNLQQSIDDALSDSLNVIVGFSDDERKMLVYSHTDTASDYYLFDAITRELRSLRPAADWIPEPNRAPRR